MLTIERGAVGMWLLLWIGPWEGAGGPVVETVDVVEFNRVFDECTGRETLRQIVLWERGRVVHWEMDRGQWSVVPGGVRVLGVGGEFREWRGRVEVVESLYDREIEDRAVLPCENRRGLVPVFQRRK